MLFTHFAAVLAAAVSVSANLLARDANTVLNDLATIKSQAQQVNQTVSNFQGDTVTALQINSQSQQLASDLQQAQKDTAALSPLSNSDAANIVNSVAGLTPVVFDTLDTLVRKYPQFQTVVLGGSANSLVKSDLISLKNNTDSFSSTLITKLPTVLAKVAPLLVGDLDYHYGIAITKFSS